VQKKKAAYFLRQLLPPLPAMSLAGALDNGLSRLIFWTERDAETISA